MKTLSERLWSRVEIKGPDDCWEWTGYRGAMGHGQIQAEFPDRRITGSHRAAWMLTNGPIPDGLHVLHKCDNPPCCNPSHLFLGTQADNNRDCFKKKRSVHFVARNSWPRGDSSWRSKITDAQALEILALVKAGNPRETLAPKYGITASAITKIINGKSRKHLTQKTY
jgi:hypothetical protein